MADIINPLSPAEMQVQQQSIDRQRKIAEYLQQQSLTPDQGQMVSGHYVAPSATQYLAKLAQGLIGKNQQSDLDEKQMGLAKQYSNGMESLARQLVSGDQSGASPSTSAPSTPQQASTPSATSPAIVMNDESGTPSVFKQSYAPTGENSPTATPSAPAPQGGNPMFKGVSPALVSNFLMNKDSPFGKIAEMQIQANLKNNELPDAVKTNNYYKLSPVEVADAMRRENANKGNTLVREDSTLTRTNPDGSVTPIFTAPSIKAGANITWNNGQPQASEIPGLAGIKQNMARAGAAGEGSVLPYSGVDAAGNPLPVTNRTTAATQAQGMASPSASPANAGFPAGASAPSNGQNTNDTLGILQQERQEIAARPDTDPRKASDLQAINREISGWQKRIGASAQSTQDPAKQNGGGIYAAPPLGKEAGAVNGQAELTKKYSDLQQQNSQAQITSSYLQNIKQQAQKAAVGPMSDKIDYVNGLLSLVGSEKATNAVTANDLLNKYSNQIVSRLGTGGLGTDAARSIIQSAYPNSHMNLGAINEASDNLQGANEMVKAKMSLLSPHGNSRDPVAYQQKEMVFDQNADPRIWQYKNLGPGTQQGKVFLQGVIKQDPAFIQKIQNLEKIGAL